MHHFSFRLLVRAELADREQRQTQVADLGEQAVQGRLISDRAGDQGLAGLSLDTARPSNQADQRLSSTPPTQIS